MTAIGFMLYIAGRLLIEVTDDWRLAMPFQVVGAIMLALGITQWLWVHMP